MTNGTVIIPCMGRSRRFTEKGWTDPKTLLKVSPDLKQEKKTILEWIIETFPVTWDIVVVVREEVSSEFRGVLAGTGIKIAAYSDESKGQSDTVRRGLDHVDRLKPVIVHNSDVLFPQPVVTKVCGEAGAGDVVVVHYDRGQEPVFSYAGSVTGDVAWEFAEKRRISPWAMTGLWRFDTGEALAAALECQAQHTAPEANGEYYLSGALQFLPCGMVLHQTWGWYDFGTPEAVEKSGWIVEK